MNWTHIKDALPNCDGEAEFIGINLQGFPAIFNAFDGKDCFFETAEENVEILDDLELWTPFVRPEAP